MNETIETSKISPVVMLDFLHTAGYSDDDIIDLLKYIADLTGWTPGLNRLGLLALKPNAPKGEEASA